MESVDRIGEAAARWLASRTSRRSFLGTTGKAALVAAGGSGLAQVFASQAQARQCGQSGISPKCPTFDCVGSDVVWGWCWYASPGCCSNGGLKKICDCCKTNHPNVQGYCPDGSAVYCMVESCLEDPRVQTVPVERYVGGDAVDVSLARSAQRKAGSASTVVVANGLDPLVSAVAAPVASMLGVPLLLADPDGERPGVHEEIDRLGVKRLLLVGGGLSGLRSLRGVESIAPDGDAPSVSVAVARWFVERSPLKSVVCVGASANARRFAASAGAYAAVRNVPLLVGASAARALRDELGNGFALLLIGNEMTDESFPDAPGSGGVDRLPGADPSLVSQVLADRLFTKVPVGTFALVVVADASAHTAVGALPAGGVVVVHGNGAIDPALRDWLIANRRRFSLADLLQTGVGSLPDEGVYDLQSAVNGYETRFLVGKDGQGLPVVAQPMEERELGKAKLSGKPIAPITVASRANGKRKPAPNPAPPVSSPPTPVPRTVPPAPSTTIPPPAPESKSGDTASTTAATVTTSTTPSISSTTRPTLPIVG